MDPARIKNISDANRAKIVSIARSWKGTPYHHQESVKGAGCDCLGLVRGVYQEYTGKPAAIFSPYSRDWAETSREETLINAAEKHLISTSKFSMHKGDVLIFRFRKWMVAKHTAILTSEHRMVHAIEGSKVEEVHLGKWWQRHIAAVFTFPEI